MPLLDLPAVGERLEHLRSRISLAQYKVAVEIGVPPRTFWSWEKGEAETSAENYDRIAAYYSEKLGEPITRDYILFGTTTAPGVAGAALHEMVTKMRSDLKRYIDDQVTAARAEILVELGHQPDELHPDRT